MRPLLPTFSETPWGGQPLPVIFISPVNAALCCVQFDDTIIGVTAQASSPNKGEEPSLIILGIDPGLATVGYGVIRREDAALSAIDFGTIETRPDAPLPDRLDRLYRGMKQLITLFHPDMIAFEELFFYNNITTAITVSHARGVLLLAAQQAGLPLYEYTPMQIKSAAAGYGHAKKPQVQQMVRILLNLKELPKPDDAADALAVAICQAHSIGPLQEQYRIG